MAYDKPSFFNGLGGRRGLRKEIHAYVQTGVLRFSEILPEIFIQNQFSRLIPPVSQPDYGEVRSRRFDLFPVDILLIIGNVYADGRFIVVVFIAQKTAFFIQVIHIVIVLGDALPHAQTVVTAQNNIKYGNRTDEHGQSHRNDDDLYPERQVDFFALSHGVILS